MDHNENLFEIEAARLALFNYRAARNFRNIWYHYPDKFGQFRMLLAQTWPGMDVEPPSVDVSHEKPRLHMFCPEERIPREIFWSGFGFQVWCQMLTHLIQGSDKSIFLIDEPDIYLHSDLQRQLVGLLRGLGPDILIATHSTEMIIEAEPDELVLIDKHKRTAQRLREPAQLQGVFRTLGSNLNPVLTQLAKTRRVLFVEGSDFQIIAKFARKLKFDRVANRRDFAVVSVEGFNPDRIRSLKAGMEATLGGPILAAAVFDRDYRSDLECAAIKDECLSFCDTVAIHQCKEIENFLLVPPALERAVVRKIDERSRRNGKTTASLPEVYVLLERFSTERKSYVISQYLDNRRRFLRKEHSSLHDTTINQQGLDYFEQLWSAPLRRLQIIPGKEAMGALNKQLQELYSISVTPTSIIDAMRPDEIPSEMTALVENIDNFTTQSPALVSRSD